MANTTLMTKGTPWKLIVSFAVPLILTNLGQQLYMIVDAAVVGRGIGVKALAAVGATDWCYWLILWTVTGVTQGFGTFVSRYYGEQNFQKMNRAITTSVWLCLGIGTIFTVAGVCFAKPLLVLLNTPSDILSGAVTYLVTMSAGTLAVTAYNMGAAILRAFGDGKHPLIAMIIAGLLNIGLDLLFVLVFHWGIFGAAIASVISQLLSFFYCLYHIAKTPHIKITRETWKPDVKELKSMLLFGIPIAAEFMLIALSGIVVQSTINVQGSTFVAGYTATNKIYGLLESTAQSFGQAFCTYFAQNFGAGYYDRVKSGVTTGLQIIGVATVVMMLLMFVAGKILLRMFINYDEAEGPAALDTAWRFLEIRVTLLIICYLVHLYRNAMQGIGSAFWPFMSGLAEFMFRIFMGVAMYNVLGQIALYYTEPVAWVGAVLACLLPYYICRKRLLHGGRISNGK